MASNVIGNVTMRVSLSLRAASKDGAAQDSLIPAAAAATLPSAGVWNARGGRCGQRLPLMKQYSS